MVKKKPKGSCIFFSTRPALSFSSSQNPDVQKFWASLTSLLIIGMRHARPIIHWDNNTNTGLFSLSTPCVYVCVGGVAWSLYKKKSSTVDGSNKCTSSRDGEERAFSGKLLFRVMNKDAETARSAAAVQALTGEIKTELSAD